MAKLSARGATVVARFRSPDGKALYAVRSDGAVLYRMESDRKWRLTYRFASTEDAVAALESRGCWRDK